MPIAVLIYLLRLEVKWNVISIIGKILTVNNERNGMPSLIFNVNEKLFGSTGCINFAGSYKPTGTSLSLEPGPKTKIFSCNIKVKIGI